MPSVPHRLKIKPASESQPSLMQREPVRVMAFVAGVMSSVAEVMTLLGHGTSVTLAIAAGLTSLSIVIGAGEVARSKAYAPATYDRDVDAHVIIEGKAGG